MNLKRLVLTNFKGIRSLDIPFSSVTNILGVNGTGKTTVADAFYWLLFDKDSTDRTDFEIKTLDENNQPYHRLDHEVTGYFDVDGQELVIRKAMREKWTKPRGSAEEVFESHEKKYFWNEVPLKKSEYQAKVASLVDESTFKMITNPLYFNQQLKWQDRRDMLVKIAGDPSSDNVLDEIVNNGNGGAGIDELVNALNSGKNLEEYKKQIAAKKKTIKDELTLIPSRIDEANRALPLVEDYEALQAIVNEKLARLQDTEDCLMDLSTADKKRHEQIGQLLLNKQSLSHQLANIDFQVKESFRANAHLRIQAINDVNRQREELIHELNQNTAAKQRLVEDKGRLELELTVLRSKWSAINAYQFQFNSDDMCCPTCKRPFEHVDVEAKRLELLANFNKDKSDKLAANVQRGKAIGNEIADLDSKIRAITAEIESIKTRTIARAQALDTLEKEHVRLDSDEERQYHLSLAENKEYQDLLLQIQTIDEQINAPADVTDKSQLLLQKQALVDEIKDLQRRLNTREQKERAEARVTELEKQESEMSQELATLEGVDYSIEQFTKTKMDMVEQRVNGLFSLVRFKMFEEQINGGQAETCVALVNGVPFSDANNASKINAGLDIINTLSHHFQVFAPIFIDNRESVLQIRPMQCQVINLVVRENVKKLKVEAVPEVAATV